MAHNLRRFVCFSGLGFYMFREILSQRIWQARGRSLCADKGLPLAHLERWVYAKAMLCLPFRQCLESMGRLFREKSVDVFVQGFLARWKRSQIAGDSFDLAV